MVTAQRKQVPRKTRGTRLRIGCLILSCKVFLNELSPRQHLVETLWVGLDLHVRQILEKELDIISGRKVVCLCCFHNAVDHCAGFCAGRRVAEQPVLSADCKGVDLVLCTIVGDFVARILQIVFHIRALSLSVLHCLFQATGQWLCAELIQPTPKSPKHRLFDRKALFLPLFRRKPLYFFFSCKELVTKVPPDLCRYRRITFRRHSLHELSSQMRPTAAACDMRDLVISGIAIGMVATGILLNRLFGFRFIFLLCLVKQTKLLFFPNGKKLFGRDRHPAECRCRQATREKQEKEERARLHYEKVQRLKLQGFTDWAMQHWTFANDHGKNPQMQLAQRYVAHWPEMREKNVGLLLWGGVGTGKSFMAGCIANALMEQEVAVCMTNFARIMNELNNAFSGRNEVVDRLCGYPLLVIDDFGVERGTEYALEQIYNIIDSRYRSRKPLIVTTNLTLTELKNPQDTAHARIYDRLLELCTPIACTGPSMRKDIGQAKLNLLKTLLA